MNRIIVERIILGFAFGIGCLIAYDYIMAVYSLGVWNGDFYARKRRITKNIVVKFPNGEPCGEIDKAGMGDSILDAQAVTTEAEEKMKD